VPLSSVMKKGDVIYIFVALAKVAKASTVTCHHCWCYDIDIESLQNRLLKVCYVPATSASLNGLLFLLLPLKVLMKRTRQAVRVIKQSILLRCLCVITHKCRQCDESLWLVYISVISQAILH
jgi:hypothetical protein